MFQYNTNLLSEDIKAFTETVIWIEGVAYKIRTLLFADPIMELARDMHWSSKTGSVQPHFMDKSIIHTRPIQRNSYLAGLRIIMDTLRHRHRESLHDAFPSWNRRRSIRISGGESSRTEAYLYQVLSPNWNYPPTLSSTLGPKARYTANMPIYPSGADRYMYFNDLVLYAERLKPFVGQYFKRTGSLGVYAEHTLTSLEVSAKRIRYVLSGVFAYMSSTRNMSVGSLEVTIERKSPRGGPLCTTVTVVGLNSTRGYKKPNSFDLRFPEYVQSTDHQDQSLDYFIKEKEELKAERFARSIHIDDLRGALYHTQGKALSKIALDLDRNFENIVEAVEFFPTISNLFLDPEGKYKEIFSSQASDIRRIKLVGDVMSSTTLAIVFGIKPAVEALISLAQGYVAPAKGEGELVYEVATVAELPDGLDTIVSNALIWGYGSDVVSHIKIKFRTEAWTTPDYQAFAQQLYNENLIFRLGAVPTPKGVWDATKLSFVLDWLMPIGTYIEDNTQYMTSFTLPFRMGHSVRFEIDLSGGRSIDFFLRSSEVNFPLDPPETSWLEAPGLPPIAILLSTKTLLGI